MYKRFRLYGKIFINIHTYLRDKLSTILCICVCKMDLMGTMDINNRKCMMCVVLQYNRARYLWYFGQFLAQMWLEHISIQRWNVSIFFKWSFQTKIINLFVQFYFVYHTTSTRWDSPSKHITFHRKECLTYTLEIRKVTPNKLHLIRILKTKYFQLHNLLFSYILFIFKRTSLEKWQIE